MRLDPATQVLPVLGGKEGIFHICQVLLDAGDIALGTDPGYPVYTSGPLLCDAEPYLLPITPENGFKPDLASIPADVLRARHACCSSTTPTTRRAP